MRQAGFRAELISPEKLLPLTILKKTNIDRADL
jgi:hypothetical protein